MMSTGNMKHIIEAYETAFRLHGDSPSSVLWPKGRQEERFLALTRNIPFDSGFSILDFGCGLSHLKKYIDARYQDVEYVGADSVPSFINTARNKYPRATFNQVSSPEELGQSYDFVVASGVFNMLYVPNREQHASIVFKMLGQLFDRANIYLSVNFMSDAVDYQQDGAYHQNVLELIDFVISNLSRRIILDCSYMPYEYTLTIWKDQNILKPENLYERI